MSKLLNLSSKQEPMLVSKIRYHFRYTSFINFTSSQLPLPPSLLPPLPVFFFCIFLSPSSTLPLLNLPHPLPFPFPSLHHPPSLPLFFPPAFFPSLSLPPSLRPSLQNGLTPLDVATNSNKGDAEGVSQALQKYMKESATAHSHHVSVWLHVLWC